MDYDYRLKMIVIGDSNTGKTCITNRLAKKMYDRDTTLTIGVDFESCISYYKFKKFKIQIWDTAGLESFVTITRQYFKNSTIVCAVYDVSNRKSFERIVNWIDVARKENINGEYVAILVGNKIDRLDRKVSREEGEKLAVKEKCLFIETSASSNIGFERMIDSCLDRVMRLIQSERNVLGVSKLETFDIDLKDVYKTAEDPGGTCCVLQ